MVTPFPFSLLFLLLLSLLPTQASSQACRSTCGNLQIKYPFGSGPGCGDPRFQPYVTCNPQQQLTLSTHTGCYPITSIDYTTHLLRLADPTMSTCSCTRPSRGFSLDWDAPFSFHHSTVFALLDCSPGSSAIYGNHNSSADFPMCDSEGTADICGLLYSCEAVSRVSLPLSSCCVYAPVDLGPAFEMDLGKLRCDSYSAVYGYNRQLGNPDGWDYGIELEYKFNYANDYPGICARCEKSNGVCGYEVGSSRTFTCNCPGGMNTSNDCYFGQTWSYSSRFFPWDSRILGAFSMTWLVIWACV